MRRGTLRLVVALALVAVLLGPVATAQAAGSNRSGGGMVWSWAGLWSWLTAAVSPLPALQADCGSHIDPDGRCATGSAAPQTVLLTDCDRGSHIDPDGRCTTASAPPQPVLLTTCDRGIMIDPNGGCVTGITPHD
jgi:hypothetical protein